MDWIEQARRQLDGALPEGSRVILFGSHARGQARPDSDLDLLVVEPEVTDRHAEMARLAALLGRAHIPADVVVMSTAAFERQAGVVNTLAWRAQREGRAL
ncbi:Nucleotidyltransferase domain protein [Tepidimonas sediminis]|uniref:Nucleotidyltransferase domain protein n=1 Tax=Tepidimonas sediminis TaxID=2588941 RepID=A0A554WLR2_9BURK|nr:nucleotidyltransferase domain-containing protein [Tepidimonas sediminis]TSE24505.1 Nucleotidyltransferase domain protein [Tepidimonas sediminis]